jgi:AraC family transcriptional regulator
MKYNEHIQKAIDFVEENLREDISLEECARESGYSMYHFTRIFRMTVGMAPMNYVRRRRFARIVLHLNMASIP